MYHSTTGNMNTFNNLLTNTIIGLNNKLCI